MALPLFYEMKRFETKNEIPVEKFKKFGKNSSVAENNFSITGYGNIELGENVHIDDNAFIQGDGGLTIGDNSHLGRNLVLHTLEKDHQGQRLPFDSNLIHKPVTIGKNVSIGMNVCIEPGTQIEDGCIIGNGAVVSGTIPALSIVSAPKATIIGQRDNEHYAVNDKSRVFAGQNGKVYQPEQKVENIGDKYQSNRALTELINYNGTKAIKKTYVKNEAGSLAFENEKEAYAQFKKYSWCPDLFEEGDHTLIFEYFPQEYRLDNIEIEQNESLLEEILWCLFELFNEGFAHGDFHSKNIFITPAGIKFIDFENTQKLAGNVDFFDSFDITGKGLNNPFDTGIMYLMYPLDCSVKNIFKINSVHEIRSALDARFKKQLFDSSLTFKTLKDTGERHVLNTKNIYSSFNLKNIKVNPAESQRNTEARIERFKITKRDIQNKRVLDIGSNIGATLLHLDVFEPAYMLGLEYDLDKVLLSGKLAKYNAIANIVFKQYDVENPDEEMIDQFEIVFCLAVIEHLKQKEKLFQLLGVVCTGKLYFEGNGTSDVQFIEKELRNAGFNKVEYLGFSNDEKKGSHNNNRPLFIATK